MSEKVRILNESGAAQFGDWLGKAVANDKKEYFIKEAPPVHLLENPATSEAFEPSVMIERKPGGKAFETRYELGKYLNERFAKLGKTTISRNTGLWNWLALYYIDQLAPANPDGIRKRFEPAFYLLEPQFNFRKYYRHAIRTPWLAVAEHGEQSKVLLIPAGKVNPDAPLAHRGELFEQLTSHQWIMGSTSIIEGANKLYFDLTTGKPKQGAGGSAGGSPRRLSTVIQQLDLTYDLRDCSADQFVDLLPREFNRWKQAASI